MSSVTNIKLFTDLIGTTIYLEELKAFEVVSSLPYSFEKSKRDGTKQQHYGQNVSPMDTASAGKVETVAAGQKIHNDETTNAKVE